MYTILIEQDDSLYGSHKERIMQRSKCVDNLVFIVEPIYRNTYDMTNATVMLEYLLPISKKYKTEILTLSDEKYNNCYLQYKLPIDTNLTSEHGAIELQLTFAYAEMDENGKVTQRIRKTGKTILNVTPISAWSDIVPDEALGGLDQRLFVMNSQIQALNDYMDVLDTNKVDNLVYDKSEDTLQLSAKGVGIGDKVSVKEMLDDGVPVVDLDSNNSSDNNENKNDCDCSHDCNCEDNVVEFGYNDSFVEPTEDNNVVEF